MTEQPLAVHEEHPTADAIAGLLATAAIVIAILALAYRPARLAPAAVIISLVAAVMSSRWRTLAGVAVAVSGLCFFVGMTIAVLTDHPLF